MRNDADGLFEQVHKTNRRDKFDGERVPSDFAYMRDETRYSDNGAERTAGEEDVENENVDDVADGETISDTVQVENEYQAEFIDAHTDTVELHIAEIQYTDDGTDTSDSSESVEDAGYETDSTVVMENDDRLIDGTDSDETDSDNDDDHVRQSEFIN
jgi:hypothetical protein